MTKDQSHLVFCFYKIFLLKLLEQVKGFLNIQNNMLVKYSQIIQSPTLVLNPVVLKV